MISRCPLCHECQYSVAQLAGHLSHTHHLYTSANTLAWIMMSSPLGREQVSEVLQDVRQFQKSIDQKKKQLERKMKELSNYKLSNMMPHVASQSKDLQDSSFDSSATKNISDASCQTSIISTCEKSCETDHDFVKPRERVLFSGRALELGNLDSEFKRRKPLLK